MQLLLNDNSTQEPSLVSSFTVFAPTDDVFDNFLQGTVDRLLNEEFRPHLIDMLLYHVVNGEIFTSAIIDGAVVETMNGETILANVNNDTITINSNSVVIAPDIDASNEVVHVVDNVLLPRSATNNIVRPSLLKQISAHSSPFLRQKYTTLLNLPLAQKVFLLSSLPQVQHFKNYLMAPLIP